MHYLIKCLNAFEVVSKAKYGKPFNLEAIEKRLRDLQHAKRLCTSDLECFKDKDSWWFERYWVLPVASETDPHLRDKVFDFHQLSMGNEGSQKERKVIDDLLSVFKSIELVSIILRFIRPDSFGILSPPVERVLDVRRGSDAVQTYLNYLRNLRDVRDHYNGLPRAADADKALWVLHEKCFANPLEDPGVKKEYEEDAFMQRLRAANLVAPWSDLGVVRLAQALGTVRDDLAGLVACYAFERFIQARAEKEDIQLISKDGRGRKRFVGLEELIDKLLERRTIDQITHAKWHRLREIRNKVFHAKVAAPSPSEIRDLIQEIIEMEKADQGKGHR